jgi:hypothetical protein
MRHILFRQLLNVTWILNSQIPVFSRADIGDVVDIWPLGLLESPALVRRVPGRVKAQQNAVRILTGRDLRRRTPLLSFLPLRFDVFPGNNIRSNGEGTDISRWLDQPLLVLGTVSSDCLNQTVLLVGILRRQIQNSMGRIKLATNKIFPWGWMRHGLRSVLSFNSPAMGARSSWDYLSARDSV